MVSLIIIPFLIVINELNSNFLASLFRIICGTATTITVPHIPYLTIIFKTEFCDAHPETTDFRIWVIVLIGPADMKTACRFPDGRISWFL